MGDYQSGSLAQAGEFFGQLVSFNRLTPRGDLFGAMCQGGFELIGCYISKFNILLPIGLFGFALLASVFMKNTNERILVFKPSYPKVLITSGMLFWCIMSFAGVSSFFVLEFLRRGKYECKKVCQIFNLSDFDIADIGTGIANSNRSAVSVPPAVVCVEASCYGRKISSSQDGKKI